MPIEQSELAEHTKGGADALLVAYGEVCNSYHAVDDFRTKLLGALPLASLVGVAFLDRKDVARQAGVNEIVCFLALFAAAFTVALFIFELRGILRCNDLIIRGRRIEERLGVPGQFFVCEYEAQRAEDPQNMYDRVAQLFNAKVAACAVYSLVFAAWLFVALRYGYGIHVLTCAICALVLGLAMAVVAYRFVLKLIPA